MRLTTGYGVRPMGGRRIVVCLALARSLMPRKVHPQRPHAARSPLEKAVSKALLELRDRVAHGHGGHAEITVAGLITRDGRLKKPHQDQQERIVLLS